MLDILANAFGGLHTIGASIGAIGALYAEICYLRAINTDLGAELERQWFTTTFNALAGGMFLVLLSSIGIVIVQYLVPGGPQYVFHSALWMQYSLSVIVIFAAWFLSRRAFPWWFGSSLIFSGWWMLLALEAWATEPISYLTLVFSYILLVFVTGGLMEYLRMLARERKVLL